jgi:hypothetical protein
LLETFCVPFEGVVEPELEGVDNNSKPEANQPEVSMIEQFKTELRKVYKDKEKALKLFQQYDKVAELSNDKETRIQLNLLYSKVIK